MGDEGVYSDDAGLSRGAQQPAELTDAYDELKRRCAESGIDCNEVSIADGRRYLTIALPCGREKRWIAVVSLDDAKSMLSVPLERYVFLGDYVAICSYPDGVIEAALRALTPQPTELLYSRLRGRPLTDVDMGGPHSVVEMRSAPGTDGRRITIGQMSEHLAALSRSGIHIPRPQGRRGPAIKIEGVHVSQHDEALALLERVANAVLFQIDLALDFPLGLARERRPIPRDVGSHARRRETELQFPQREYEEAPTALYWYARSAVRMPLLQYLAYYQSIEYYFATYSQTEAKRKIQNILKDPLFRAERDSDITRILSAARTSGYGYGDERSQLAATIRACVDPDALREFLSADEKRKEFFSSKAKHLTDKKIPIGSAEADLRKDVAERIYDIRCKIVHTKGTGREGQVELLLPFSKEAELLYFDIDLLQYIAREVLIASSVQLTW